MLQELQVTTARVYLIKFVIHYEPFKYFNLLQNVVDFAKNIPLTDDELFHMPTSIATTLMTKVRVTSGILFVVIYIVF